MKKRFLVTLAVACTASTLLGIFAPDVSHVLMGTLVVGLCYVLALLVYVVRSNAPESNSQEG